MRINRWGRRTNRYARLSLGQQLEYYRMLYYTTVCITLCCTIYIDGYYTAPNHPISYHTTPQIVDNLIVTYTGKDETADNHIERR